MEGLPTISDLIKLYRAGELEVGDKIIYPATLNEKNRFEKATFWVHSQMVPTMSEVAKQEKEEFDKMMWGKYDKTEPNNFPPTSLYCNGDEGKFEFKQPE